jgi:hypothetical protein
MKDKNDVDAILNELKTILLKKQDDYGPLNISLAPGGPYNGLRVRMFDKLQRFSHLIQTGNDTPNFESLRDTFIDLANYAIIGILVQNGQWEGIPNDNTTTQSGGIERPADTVSRRHGCQCSDEVHSLVQAPRIVVRG